MPRSVMDRIRQKLRQKAVELTPHAVLEAMADELTPLDVERSLQTGRLLRREKDDPRGTKYIVVGRAMDGERQVATVGRFMESGRYRIITVYKVD